MLGVIHERLPAEARPNDDPHRSLDLPFWKEISQIVHDILVRAYVSSPDVAQSEAARRGVTVEQLVSSSIAYRVMSKVDHEYV
jgi:hypothetical protein